MATPRKPAPNSERQPPPPPKRPSTESPLIFISHDTRDADLAEAFRNLLTDASGGILKSFQSSDRKGTAGFEYGEEWYGAIMQKLDEATAVVALLTRNSMNRPWILYETGVAKGKLAPKERVFGIALGVSLEEAATGPFAQFQNSAGDEDAITGVALQLIRRHPDAAPREEAVRLQVKTFLKTVDTLLKDRKVAPTKPVVPVDETSVAKFFEEIKVLVRDVPDRVASELSNDPRMRRIRKHRRLHPMMLEEMFHHPLFRESSDRTGLPILMTFSMLRDDFPWLYELGIQLYRAIEDGDSRAIERARRTIMETIELAHRGPFMHEMMGSDDDEAMSHLHHLMHMVDRFVGEPKRLRKPESKPDPGKD